MGSIGIISVWPAVLVVILFFSVVSVGHCDHELSVLVLELPPVILDPPLSIVHIAPYTLILHISACIDLIWSSCWLHCVVKFAFIVVSSVIISYISAVANEEFMNESPSSMWFTLFVIPYPDSPAVCTGYSRSKYDSLRCVLKRTHVRSFFEIISTCDMHVCIIVLLGSGQCPCLKTSGWWRDNLPQ